MNNRRRKRRLRHSLGAGAVQRKSNQLRKDVRAEAANRAVTFAAERGLAKAERDHPAVPVKAGVVPPTSVTASDNAKQKQREESIWGDRLEVHMAEYNSLRDEVLARLEGQRQAVNFLLVALAGTLSAFMVSIDKTSVLQSYSLDLREWAAMVGLLVPMIAGPLIFMFFDNEFMMFRNGYHILHHIKPDCETMVGEGVLEADVKGFECLLPPSVWAHTLVSYARWIMFFIPTALPVIFGYQYLDHWDRSFWDLVWWIDLAVTLLLLSAVVMALAEQLRWKLRR